MNCIEVSIQKLEGYKVIYWIRYGSVDLKKEMLVPIFIFKKKCTNLDIG